MPVELFIQAFKGGKGVGVPVAAIRHAFGPYLKTTEEENWTLVYDDRNRCQVYAPHYPADRNQAGIISVLEPFDDPRLWEGLFAILGLGRIILFKSSECVLATDTTVSNELPKGLLKDGVQVKRVMNSTDIRHAIVRA
jgi:hypothetical protein